MFSKLELQEIEAAVKNAESRTAGEIVPMVVPVSGNYVHISYRLGLFLLVVFSVIGFLLYKKVPFFELAFLASLQALGWVLGWSLGQIPWVIRFFLPTSSFAAEVHETAMAAFMREGLTETKGRTGVLIFISLLERRVEILADKGIHGKVDPSYWESQVNVLVRGLQEGRSKAALVEVIGSIGTELTRHFPASAENKNELSDQLRT